VLLKIEGEPGISVSQNQLRDRMSITIDFIKEFGKLLQGQFILSYSHPNSPYYYSIVYYEKCIISLTYLQLYQEVFDNLSAVLAWDIQLLKLTMKFLHH